MRPADFRIGWRLLLRADTTLHDIDLRAVDPAFTHIFGIAEAAHGQGLGGADASD